MDHLDDRPYPILRLFDRRVLPALVLSAVILVVTTWFGVRVLELKVYMETTSRRSAAIAELAHDLAPEAWAALVASSDPRRVYEAKGGKLLAEILSSVTDDGHISRLKIFTSEGLAIYSTKPKEIGVREENELLTRVFETNQSEIETTVADGLTYYEIYTPVTIRNGRRVVFETYEPASVLDDLILKSFVLPAAISMVVLVALGIWTRRLVRGAQADIDQRVDGQMALRRQLERFVSISAAGAARMAPDGTIPSVRVNVTLFYSDVRDFSSLAEFQPPSATVDFLNRLMTMQVEVIRRHGGDVDKMIGDALLARFEGGDREARAIRAAQDILTEMAATPLVRGVGVGVYDGEVILGAIGHVDRQDFTVIGDSVNIAARLCSLAGEGELVVDELALRRSGLPAEGFLAAEEQKVKGRVAMVSIRRWRLP
ncbi:MAG: adenylate/guanylate cyclase domain-containing protein [Alphaproteobacteria bacterium]